MAILSLPHPLLIQPGLHARNGLYPDTAFHNQLTGAANWLLAYRRKEVFRWSRFLTSATGDGGVGPTVILRSRFRTGMSATAINLIVGLGLRERPHSSDDPRIKITLTKVGGGSTSLEFHYGQGTATPTDAPNEWSEQIGQIPVDELSEYTAEVEVNDQGRLLWLCGHELGPNAGVDTHHAAAGAPIIETDIQAKLATLSDVHRYNAGTMIQWSRVGSSSQDRTSATFANLIDGSTTGTPTATTLGWRIDTYYRRSYGRADVPYELAVYASMASGSGTVRVTDTAGTSPISITVNSSTPQWWTATGFLIGDDGTDAPVKYDPMFAGDGSNLLSVYELVLAEWEA